MKAPIEKVAAAFLIMAACDGNSNSPTQPTLPRVSTVTANYFLTFGGESGTPQEVQVFLDGVVIYSGPMSTYSFDYGYEPYLSGEIGSLFAGRHVLSLKVTRQAVSPTTYHVSGRVEAVHKVNGVNVDAQGASWEEPVTLATGDAWTGVFEFREWRG